MIEKLRYRSAFTLDGNIGDIVDGEHCKNLQNSYVKIEDRTFPFKFFASHRDLCPGFSLDGFAP
jgi:hypothetical protein